MFWLILAVAWAIFFWDFYLSIRQYRVHRDNEKRPANVTEIISEDEYRKARLYKLDKHRFNFVYSLYSQIELTVVLLLYVPHLLWSLSGAANSHLGASSEIAQTNTFVVVVTVIESVISLPWQLYDTFVIEERHGFNKQTVAFFFKDKFKKTLVLLVIMVPVVTAVIYIVDHGGPFFFFYLWIFLSLIIFLLMTVYPEFIAPLFDKYVHLPESDLRTKIEKLAARVHFPLTKLFVVRGSKRSVHSNAYMYGFWNNKRIVLYDTLLSDELNAVLKMTDEDDPKKDDGDKKEERKLGMSDDEVVAVLGHELGHWALWHTVINLTIAEVNLLLLLVVFAYFYRSTALFNAFGFYDSKPTVIGLMIVFQYITAPYNELITFLTTVMSRRLEFSADAYSQRLGLGDELCKALIKLGKDNLSLPVDDPLYSMCNHSHPPIPERIDAIRKSK